MNIYQSLSDLLVAGAYVMDSSDRYNKSKAYFYDLLVNPASGYRPYVDFSMISLVLISVVILIYDVRHDLPWWGALSEQLAIGIFIIEYLLRLWLHNDIHKIVIEHNEKSLLINRRLRWWPVWKQALAAKWAYMTTPLAIIDLLAILPSYRPLRILRVFLLFRLFKLFRYARSINQFSRLLAEKRLELSTLLIVLTFLLFTSASAIYLFESSHEGGQIETFFDGIYWALVTMSTVGYGDITPTSNEGRFITLILIISGIGVLSFFTSIIVSAFNEKMTEIREYRVYADLERRQGYTIICGFGRVGRQVAKLLSEEKQLFVVVEINESSVQQAEKDGFLCIRGNPEDAELLANLGVGTNAGRVLCLTGSDVSNVYITLTARHLDPNIEIISRANADESLKKLVLAGANHTVEPYKLAGLIAGEYIGQPVAFEAIYSILSGDHDIRLDTMTVHAGSGLENKQIKQLDFTSQNLIVFGVINNLRDSEQSSRSRYSLYTQHFHFNPDGNFRLQENDILVMFGHHFSLYHFREMAGVKS